MMTIIKTVLTGLAGFSLIVADISGIVIDTGATPLSGAVVRLEKGGQTAISGPDGRFTLVVSASIYPGNRLPNGLSARISNAMLHVTVPERSVVRVSTYDLHGKTLSSVQRIMEAGIHSIALPQRDAGINLYKVQAGNYAFVLKGNLIGGSSRKTDRATDFSRGCDASAIQVKAGASINDVIAVSKHGYLNYLVAVTNPDTSSVVIKMTVCADTVKDIDGNVYQAAGIGEQVWIVENLRVTRYNDGTPVPYDSSPATWAYVTTPMFCYYGNTTDADTIRNFGALYNWYVVSPANPKAIAPAGWHVPSDSEWTVLEKYMVLNGYNWDGTTGSSAANKTAKSLAAKADWLLNPTTGTVGCDLTKNNSSGFSALPGGYRGSDGAFRIAGISGFWWSTTEYAGSFAYYRTLSNDADSLSRGRKLYYFDGSGFSVRLIRDKRL